MLDSHLEAAIRDILDKPSGDITRSDCESIVSLTLRKAISDFTGIENLTNLTYLNLSYNQISDIISLNTLTNLIVK